MAGDSPRPQAGHPDRSAPPVYLGPTTREGKPVTGLAIALAVVAAGCFAVAAWLQQHTVRTVAAGGGLRLAGWARMVRAPRWMAGLGLTALGAILHAGALSLAPLVVVQPIGVLAIALTTLLSARSTGARLSRSTTLAVLASTLGVGMFVALTAGRASSPALPAGAEVRAALVAWLIVGALGALGALARGRLRCLAFAGAAGVAYGLVSVLVHSTAVGLETGGPASIPLVPAMVVVAALLVGGWFVQHAYATGSPQVVVASQTVLDPMLGVGIGVGFLGEAANLTAATTVGLLACAALAVAGVIVLAHHNTNHRQPTAPSTVEPTVTALDQPDSPEDRPLRVVVGADTFPPDINGASRFAERLAGGLAGRGHEVHVLCPATRARSTAETAGSLTVHRVASRRTPFHPTFRVCPPWAALRAAADLLDDVRPDVVHVQAHFLLGRGLVRAAAKRGVPVIATNHFMPENLYGHAHIPHWLRVAAAAVGWWDLRRVFAVARTVTAPTPSAVRLLAQHGVPGAVAVSCGLDIARFHRQRPAVLVASEDVSARRVLFVGRLDEEKRVDDLLRAVAFLHEQVADRDADIRLEIVGDGSRRTAWENLAASLGVRERVHFHGFVPEHALVAAYTRCDVFCMPGIAELQSLATMEAMAAGKPVIAADAMALPHLVLPGRNGWLYPPGDVPALAGHLLYLLTDPDSRARMGAASRQLIAEHTLDRTLDTFESLYHQAVDHRQASPVVRSRTPAA
jgi:glycosyltransferase involved in cell wall biosynthesis